MSDEMQTRENFDLATEDGEVQQTKEQLVLQSILHRFPVLDQHVHIQRKQRVMIDALSTRDFEKVFRFLTTDGGFHNFHLIIGTDDGPHLGFNYMLSNEDNIVMLVRQRAPKSEPVIKSICSRFPNALWHERELVDLLGAVVEGLPDGPSYPLPDRWPEGNYPLRKEWKVEYFDKMSMTYNPPITEQAENSTAADDSAEKDVKE